MLQQKTSIARWLLDNSLRHLKKRKTNSQDKTQVIYCGNVLSGVVAMVAGILMSRVPVMALTFKSPNLPFLTASPSIESTSLSLTVELNFKARSTVTLPHLGIAVTN